MSASIAAAAAAALQSRRRHTMSSNSIMNSTYGGTNHHHHLFAATRPTTSRYETLKQRDWNTFDQYLKNHKPVPLTLSKCGSEHVLEFLRYLDRFGETKHDWSSLDAVVDRLWVAFEEKGGRPETNPFGAPDVKLYLRQVRDSQAKALPM